MLLQQITDDMKAAMKAGDKAKLAAIRMLRAAIKDREIELGHALDDTETQAVVARLVKQRNDAANQYREAGRSDLETAELSEAALLQAYLPEPLSDSELAALVDAVVAETGAAGMRDMGKVMAGVKERAEGRADMSKVSGLVKARLS